MPAHDNTAPPRDGLVRARPQAVELRATSEDGMPTLTGHFAVFDEFTEIDSLYEGNFLERIAPGAFKKTMKEQRDDIKVLFQHGHDPQIADKPLGKIESLREDEQGGFYEVSLLDTAYVRDLLPGLEAGLYGASFRFRVVAEDYNKEPERSDHNPAGIPERTITEARLYEFGPVTFPAYASATAGVRSLTDEEVLVARMREKPEQFSHILDLAKSEESRAEEAHPDAPDDAEAQDTSPHVEPGREPQTPSKEFRWDDLLPKQKWEF